MNIQKYSKNQLVKAMADMSGVNILTVETVLQSFEAVVTSMLQNANSHKSISIKLFDGFYINSEYVPEKQKRNNITGKFINVASKIKIKPRITRRYIEKINQ